MYTKFCCGCGLCKAVHICEMKMNKSGFISADGKGDEFQKFCESVCPSSGVQTKEYDASSVWGRQVGVYLAFSSNEEIRYQASSGGVLTSLSVYLLENHLIDGIIHTATDPSNPIMTQTFCSTTPEEVITRCGSRYSASTPLTNIISYFIEDKSYVYVGKPCDVTALRNYAKIDSRVEKHIKYMLSFFCAGAPSEKANLQLLDKLNVSLHDCKSLKYRGDGWPGYATAVDKMGEIYKIPYAEAWGETLGRDIRLICRFCIDGIGEMADISCGDAWYLDMYNKPDFSESDGRNVVFCRNQKGLRLLEDAVEAGYIKKSEYETWNNEIDKYQKYQLQRRKTMKTTILAMSSMGKGIPKYEKRVLKAYAKDISLKEKLRRYLGTVKRILQGNIK